MRGARRRQVEDLPTAELEAVAQVEVLAEHEVAGVEEANSVERRCAKHQTRGRPRVHLVHVGVGDVTHVVAAEPRTLGKELAQPDRLKKERARNRKGAAGGGGEAAVRQ